MKKFGFAFQLIACILRAHLQSFTGKGGAKSDNGSAVLSQVTAINLSQKTGCAFLTPEFGGSKCLHELHYFYFSGYL